VPDFYQGSELWTTTLVDPDNRGDVDFAERVRLLDELDALGSTFDVDHIEHGSLKLWLTRRLLQIRRADLDTFVGPDATYAPLELRGARAAGAVAFVRGGRVAVVASIRAVALDRQGWEDTSVALPDGSWFDALRDGTGAAGDGFSGVVPLPAITHHGCAVLIRSGGST